MFAGQSVDIAVEVNIIDKLGSLVRRYMPEYVLPQVVVISDTNVWPLYGERARAGLRSAGLALCERCIAAGEASKSWATAGELFGFLADRHVGRDAVIVALGGGVVCDLAGFVAATWMRGVRLVICPTTLEADIDAAIGGKNAINIPGGKNLVGAYHQPILAAIDPACLATLPRRDYCAAMAESVKHALISSADFLEWHETNVDAILARDGTVTMKLIEENIRIKADIVSRDTTEQTGVRALLNFGHTIGHAIEECCGFALRHGECVSLGLLAACRLSHRLGMLDSASVERVERMLERFNLPTLLECVPRPPHPTLSPATGERGYRTTLSPATGERDVRTSLSPGGGEGFQGAVLEKPIDPDRILFVMRNDKKIRGGAAQFVLLEGIGRPVVRGDISESAIRDVLQGIWQ